MNSSRRRRIYLLCSRMHRICLLMLPPAFGMDVVCEIGAGVRSSVLICRNLSRFHDGLLQLRRFVCSVFALGRRWIASCVVCIHSVVAFGRYWNANTGVHYIAIPIFVPSSLIFIHCCNHIVVHEPARSSSVDGNDAAHCRSNILLSHGRWPASLDLHSAPVFVT